MRLAIIGLGKQGRKHFEAAHNLAEKGYLELAAICDNRESVRHEYADTRGLRYYSDYQEMLQNEKLDSVVISTHNNLHKEICIDAMNYGCNILKEKPLALSISESKELIECAEARNCILQVAQQRAHLEVGGVSRAVK